MPQNIFIRNLLNSLQDVDINIRQKIATLSYYNNDDDEILTATVKFNTLDIGDEYESCEKIDEYTAQTIAYLDEKPINLTKDLLAIVEQDFMEYCDDNDYFYDDSNYFTDHGMSIYDFI